MDFKIYEKEVINLRHYFRSHPEVSSMEVETTKYISKYMSDLGYKITLMPETGLTALLFDDTTKPAIAIRCEIDALPINDEIDAPYGSQNKGVCHACGHDGNIATALVLAKIIAQNKESFNKNIKFMFEPAEETGSGAKYMLENKAFENPDVESFIMFHYSVGDKFGMSLHEKQASATVGNFEITVNGKSSHWCVPQKGVDAIFGVSKVIEALNNINKTSTEENPFIIGTGIITGGTANNIISDKVTITGNIRTWKYEDYFKLSETIKKAISDADAITGCKTDVFIREDPIKSIENNSYLVSKALGTGKEIFGDKCFIEKRKFLSGDNASIYFTKTKGVLVVFLAALENNTYPLHHPKMDLNDKNLIYAVETLYKLILNIQ